jgi:hypothetical protein
MSRTTNNKASTIATGHYYALIELYCYRSPIEASINRLECQTHISDHPNPNPTSCSIIGSRHTHDVNIESDPAAAMIHARVYGVSV